VIYLQGFNAVDASKSKPYIESITNHLKIQSCSAAAYTRPVRLTATFSPCLQDFLPCLTPLCWCFRNRRCLSRHIKKPVLSVLSSFEALSGFVAPWSPSFNFDFDFNPFREAFSFVPETPAVAAATFIVDFSYTIRRGRVGLEMG
jgi:hypothetical protein